MSAFPEKPFSYQKVAYVGAASFSSFFCILAGYSGIFPFFFLLYIAQIPLFILSFMEKFEEAIWACFISSFLIFLSLGEKQVISYILLFVTPAVVLSYLRQKKSNNKLAFPFLNRSSEFLIGLVMMGIGFFIVLQMLNFSDQSFVQSALKESIFRIVGKGHTDTLETTVNGFIQRAIFYLPAFSSLSWLSMTLINLATSQALIKKFSKSLKDQLSLENTVIPLSAYICIILSLCLSVLLGEERIGQNLLLVSLFPFFIEGISILQKIFPRLAKHSWRMGALYFFILAFVWPLFIIVFMGFIEPWVQLRHKFQQKNKKGSD